MFARDIFTGVAGMDVVLRSLLLIALSFGGLTLAHAHHSGAMYDRLQSVTVEGVVTKLEWANPHVYVYVRDTTDSGAAAEWKVEMFPPAVMRRHGWFQDTLQVGDTITMTGSPTRRADSRGLYPARIRQGDDTLYDVMEGTQRLMRAGAEPQAGAQDLDGTWETLLALDITLAFFNVDFPLTDQGTAAVAAYDDRTMNPGIDCVANAAPLFMLDPDIKRITSADGRIRIDGGYGAAQRTIHMDMETHAGAPRSVQGHSIGHWEDETLVIDTTQFADHRTGNGYGGVPSGSQKHLVERLKLNEDGTRLIYRFELSDPEYLAAPVRGELQWAFRPDLEFMPEECSLENARRFIEEL